MKETSRQLTNNFKLIDNKENYVKLINKFCSTENIYCKYCNDIIYYEDTQIQLNKKETNISIYGKSHRLEKNINKEYFFNLVVCKKCLIHKFPILLEKNYKKWFNTWNQMSFYAFDVNDEQQQLQSKLTGITLENLTRKYGEEIAIRKWNVYKEKQAISNSLKYKQEKHGWTEDEFNTFNKSRAVTVENLIKKHGEFEGLNMWYKYVEKQQKTKSKEYYVSKYGEDAWVELCKSKTHNMENYIKWYGDHATAMLKYTEYYDNLIFNNKNKYSGLPKSVSMSSQKYFNLLEIELKRLKRDIQVYYYEKDKKEYMKFLNGSLVYLDFYIKDFNLCIEFNGDIYHGNPKIFSATDKPMPHFNEITCEELWIRDKLRIDTLKSQYDMDTIVIWESEQTNQKELAEQIINKYNK